MVVGGEGLDEVIYGRERTKFPEEGDRQVVVLRGSSKEVLPLCFIDNGGGISDFPTMSDLPTQG